MSIELHNADFGEWAVLRDLGASLVVMDPPWDYDNFSDAVHGAAHAYYSGLSMKDIHYHAYVASTVAAENAYLALWCTWPKLAEWFIEPQNGWEYITGGAWGKTNGLGVGFHFRGDSEPLLLYKRGKPQPRTHTSNLWLAPRIGHSEKPQNALRALIQMATDPGDLVLDPYAGASASLMRACRALGRAYVGCEIDPARHAEALRRYALDEQSVMEFAGMEAAG